MSVSLLGALIVTNPDEARSRILAAIKSAKGDRRAAAKALGTTTRSFYRHIERLRLWEAVDEQCAEQGFRKPVGPPRMPKKIRDELLVADGSLARAARALDITPEALSDRITDLDLWDELNNVLAAAGLARIVPVDSVPKDVARHA